MQVSGPLRGPTGASPLATKAPNHSEPALCLGHSGLQRFAQRHQPFHNILRIQLLWHVYVSHFSLPCDGSALSLAKSCASLEGCLEKKILPTAQRKIAVLHCRNKQPEKTLLNPANTTPAHPASAARPSRSGRNPFPAQCNCIPGLAATPRSTVAHETPPTPDTARTLG